MIRRRTPVCIKGMGLRIQWTSFLIPQECHGEPFDGSASSPVRRAHRDTAFFASFEMPKTSIQ